MQSSEKKQTTTSDISENWGDKMFRAGQKALQEAAEKQRLENERRHDEIVRAALQEAARKARQGK